MQVGEILHVQLDRGEPEEMVIPGLRDAGHQVVVTDRDPASVMLEVTCGS
jgi:hypothetical protein